MTAAYLQEIGELGKRLAERDAAAKDWALRCGKTQAQLENVSDELAKVRTALAQAKKELDAKQWAIDVLAEDLKSWIARAKTATDLLSKETPCNTPAPSAAT